MQSKAGTHHHPPYIVHTVSTFTSPLFLSHAVSYDDTRFILCGFLVIFGEQFFMRINKSFVIDISLIQPTQYQSTLMDWRSNNCSRCHAIVDFGCDICSVCQLVFPATVSPWPTIQAHNGGVGSPPNANALDDAATPNSAAHIPVIPKLTLVRSGFIH